MNNKTMNKTLNFILIIVMMLLSIQLVSALSFQDLADDMQSFASGSYSENNKAIDFILFFILFTSVCYIGLKQAMGDKEGIGGAVKALSAALGTALTLALISFTEFSLFIFYPFAKGLIFFLFVLLVFFVLTKIGMEKHKVWAFIIALILALVIFNFGAMWIGANKGDNDFSLGSFAGKFSLGGIKDRLNIDGIKEKFSSSKESGKTKAEIALDDIYLKIGELTSIGDNKILRLYKTEKSLEERISTELGKEKPDQRRVANFNRELAETRTELNKAVEEESITGIQEIINSLKVKRDELAAGDKPYDDIKHLDDLMSQLSTWKNEKTALIKKEGPCIPLKDRPICKGEKLRYYCKDNKWIEEDCSAKNQICDPYDSWCIGADNISEQAQGRNCKSFFDSNILKTLKNFGSDDSEDEKINYWQTAVLKCDEENARHEGNAELKGYLWEAKTNLALAKADKHIYLGEQASDTKSSDEEYKKASTNCKTIITQLNSTPSPGYPKLAEKAQNKLLEIEEKRMKKKEEIINTMIEEGISSRDKIKEDEEIDYTHPATQFNKALKSALKELE